MTRINPPQSPFFKGGGSIVPSFRKGGLGRILAVGDTFRDSLSLVKHSLDSFKTSTPKAISSAREVPVCRYNHETTQRRT